MEKKAVFTICAKNYIGLAEVLKNSVVRQDNAVDFYIFVVDELRELKLNDEEEGIIESRKALDFSDEEWDDLSFKYSLTEFATMLKPFCFEFLFNSINNYDKAIYLDPDIYVFSSLEGIFGELSKHSIILTPHFCNISNNYSGDFEEHAFLAAGVFNLGFLALRKDQHSKELLSWWGNKLKTDCFVDIAKNTATDQKWMSLLPAFFPPDVMHISRNQGLNVAPWNFFERRVLSRDGKLFIQSRADENSTESLLVFVHFSNYNYKELVEGVINHRSLKSEYKDLDLVFDEYVKALQTSSFMEYLRYAYTYNYFSNSVPVAKIHRRLYRSLTEQGEIIVRPFSVERSSFFTRLKKSGLITRSVVDQSRQTGFHITKSNNGTFDRKRRYLFSIFKFIMRVIGIKRYLFLLAFLSKYSRLENQSFLVKS